MTDRGDWTEDHACHCCGRTVDSVVMMHGMDLCEECAIELMEDAGCPCAACCGG